MIANLIIAAAALAGQLDAGFINPPPSAKPHTWYHMMNGNVTKAGITRDFEALAEAGFGGVQMFDAGCDIPPGGLDFNSPEWFDMFRHAASEARRLGLEICIPNCSGWSSSGGPWIAPSNGMKRIVFTETRVKGPMHFHGELPRTKKDNGYYADIATVAFPLPKAEWGDERVSSQRTRTSVVPVEARVGGVVIENGERLADGKNDPVVKMKRGDGEKNVIQIDYPQGIPAVGLDLQIIGGDSWAEVFTLEVEANGEAVISRPIALAQSGARDTSIQFVPFPRLLTVKSLKARFKFGKTGRLHEFTVGELRPVARRRIADWGPKTFAFRRPVPEDRVPTPDDCLIRKEEVRDVSSLVKDSVLDWDVPAGEWVVLRVGSICNGRCNHPASDHGRGLEVDKLDAAAMDFHFEQYVARLCRELGDLAGNVKSGFNNILVDSFEVGSQNWTQKFEEEFMRRRGYSLRPYLPVFAGRIVGGTEETDRFLEDFRRVVADLFAENYAGALAKKCHQYGLLCSLEPYGNCPADNLQYGQYVDIPMGEFWSHTSNPYAADAGNAKFVSYIAHVWGRRYCATESFTASPSANSGRWMTTPFGIKHQSDRAFADGVNRLIYHRFTHQPWADDKYLPGMTMGRWGMHLDRTQTWWPFAKPFFRYQSRCQYMLQRGMFAADVLFFEGEEAPNQGGNVDGGAATRTDFSVPFGYDKDICPTDAMYALKVENGEVVVPGGVRYRVLAIPPVKAMTPKMLRQILKLRREGANVVWRQKPERAPGCSLGAKGDEEVRRLADEVFAAGVLQMTVSEALAKLGVGPQVVEVKVRGKGEGKVSWIHRYEPTADWFFVALPNRDATELDLSFRISGREPEIWDAESGEIKSAPVWREENGRTIVRVPFEVCGSKFVVFRKPATSGHFVSADVKARRFAETSSVPAEKIVFLKAQYGADTRQKDLTVKMNELAKAGFVDETVGNMLAGGDPARMTVKHLTATYVYRGVTNEVTLREHQQLVVPPSHGHVSDPLPLEIAAGADGTPRFLAWQPLTATLVGADGQKRTVSIDVPAPIVIDGPWQVEFPNGFLPNALAKGAAETVVFDELESWSERPESGVRYFSGRAVYRKKVKVGDWRAESGKCRVILDLGTVHELAQVTVNGKTFEPMWRPPYRLDITDAVKGETLDLEICVANLWANRLIGDDREYAPDCEWKGMVRRGTKEIGIKEIPQWVKEGKPSPTGRHTFTTWKHWDKNDELQPSGLIGPVKLRFVLETK